MKIFMAIVITSVSSLLFLPVCFSQGGIDRDTDCYTIPPKLNKLGFTKDTLTDYSKAGNKELFTFSDWRTVKSGDTVTFVVENGKVIEEYKEEAREKKDVEI